MSLLVPLVIFPYLFAFPRIHIMKITSHPTFASENEFPIEICLKHPYNLFNTLIKLKYTVQQISLTKKSNIFYEGTTSVDQLNPYSQMHYLSTCWKEDSRTWYTIYFRYYVYAISVLQITIFILVNILYNISQIGKKRFWFLVISWY
jgi:hypothetical protein